jgi:hypothetical protein|nr:hypothetical protein [Brucella anthropi]
MASKEHEALVEKVARPTDGYLIVKRDLYYMPNSCGYTGIRDQAGRYSLEYASMLADHHCADGLTYIHESEAPEFRNAAFSDLVIAHLIKQRDELRAQLAASALGEKAE